MKTSKMTRRQVLRYNQGRAGDREREAAMDIDINDKAPEFTLSDQNGHEVSLKDFRGKTVVLFFFPKADTPG
jgi:peroxiredoxin